MGVLMKVVVVSILITCTATDIIPRENVKLDTSTKPPGLFDRLKSSVKSAAHSVFGNKPTATPATNKTPSPTPAPHGAVPTAAVGQVPSRGSFPGPTAPSAAPAGQVPGRGSSPMLTPPTKAPEASPRVPYKDPFPALTPAAGIPVVGPRAKDPFPALTPQGGASAAAVLQVPGGVSYAQKVSGGVTTQPPNPAASTTAAPELSGITDTELREFSEALLRKDTNNAFRYVTLNLQAKTTSQSKKDEAPLRLLDIQDAVFKIPTIEKLRPLYNNYIVDSNENEYVTPQEKNEENDLLDAILGTPVMQHTRNMLIQKEKISKDPKDFKDLLKLIWFGMYSRLGGRIGSSGFEHIFLTETKKGDISGLHNWLYFSEMENANRTNYLGYMRNVDLGEKGSILKFHFTLGDLDKPVGSMFIGTSPELEMALYTTCFMFRADKICPMKLNDKRLIIRTYSYKYRGKKMIGSAFPEI